LIAGNHMQTILNRPDRLFRLDRSEAYIGVLIDDLILTALMNLIECLRRVLSIVYSSGTTMPTIVSSRTDGACGLVGDAEWDRPIQRRARLAAVRQLLKEYKIRSPGRVLCAPNGMTGQDLGDSLSLAQLALRPGVTPQTVSSILSDAHADVTLTDLETAPWQTTLLRISGNAASIDRRLHQPIL